MFGKINLNIKASLNSINLPFNFESEPNITVALKIIDIVSFPKLEQNVSEWLWQSYKKTSDCFEYKVCIKTLIFLQVLLTSYIFPFYVLQK